MMYMCLWHKWQIKTYKQNKKKIGQSFWNFTEHASDVFCVKFQNDLAIEKWIMGDWSIDRVKLLAGTGLAAKAEAISID